MEVISFTGKHNHDLVDEDIALSRARHVEAEVKQQLKSLQDSGVKAKEQLAFLRRYDNNVKVVARDIYNEKQKQRREFLNGRTPLQALFDVMSEEGYYYFYQVDQNEHISHLLVAHPSSVQMIRRYYSVILLDCTYKTNRYKMPLLEAL